MRLLIRHTTVVEKNNILLQGIPNFEVGLFEKNITKEKKSLIIPGTGLVNTNQ